MKNYQSQIEQLNISSSIGNLSSVLSSVTKNYQSQIEQLNISSSIGNLSSALSSVTKNYQSQIEQLNISSSIGNLSSVLSLVAKNYQTQIQGIKKIANFSSLDLKALNEIILSYDKVFCDSSEFKEANVIEVKNEEINLKDI
jgi:type II secretory pathway component PulF